MVQYSYHWKPGVPSSPSIWREIKKEWSEGQCRLFDWNKRNEREKPSRAIHRVWEPKTFRTSAQGILLGGWKIGKLYIHIWCIELWLGVKSFLNEVDRSKLAMRRVRGFFFSFFESKMRRGKIIDSGNVDNGFYIVPSYVCQKRSG